MTNVGIMASSVNSAPVSNCVSVLREPFANFTAAPWAVSSTPAIVAGRNGTAGEINSISDQLNYNLAAPVQSDSITMGFAWRTPALQVTHEIVGFRSDSGATTHSVLFANSSGGLSVSRGGTGIAGPTAGGLVTVNTWYYLEVQIKLHDTAGIVIVRLNGTTVINASGLDTRNAGTKAVYDQVRLSTPNGSSGGINQYDDLYLTVGSDCTFQGDQVIP